MTDANQTDDRLDESFRQLSIATDTPKKAAQDDKKIEPQTVSKTKKTRTKKEPEPELDSWEDADLSSDDQKKPLDDQATPVSPATAATPPKPRSRDPDSSDSLSRSHSPKPHPLKHAQSTSPPPSLKSSSPSSPLPASSSSSPSSYISPAPTRRPEKQTVVANRMIAHALGLRMPRRTSEQRGYDRAVIEGERRRRERKQEEAQRRAAEEEAEKVAVWDQW